MSYQLIITFIFVAFAALEILLGRFFHWEASTRKDVIIEVVVGLAFPLLIVPGIFFAAPLLLGPSLQNRWADLPGWAMFLILLVADDLAQYSWHRLAHSHPLLYRFHRAHHSAEYLSVRVVYRNSLLYFATLPGLWLSAALVHLGFGPVYAVYAIAKMTVVTAAHSSVAWDEPLRRVPVLRPLMWLLTRTISTPRTHAAHHGKHAGDGVTHYKGNYGNFLFLWDVLFGTARIGPRRPDLYGLENVTPKKWYRELLF